MPDGNEKLLRTQSLVQIMGQHLECLPDLLTCLGTGYDMRELGSALGARWFESIVQSFFGAHFAEMRHLLHVTSTLITGSCARQMLTGQGATPNDLNLITPLGSAEILYASLVGDLQYERFEVCARPNYAFTKVVKGFTRFRKGEMIITISEAEGDNLFKVVVSSPTTVDMTVMTPGGLVMFYPAWTLSKDNVGCMAKDGFRVERSTDFLGEDCGKACPALWRSVLDHGEQMLMLEWDERFSIKKVVDGSQTMWCLIVHCENDLCAYNPKNNPRSRQLMPHRTPSGITEIEVQEARIAQHWPDYQGILQGVLYATSAKKAHLVSIPLRDGVDSLVDMSQLDVSHWVDQLGPERLISSTGQCRKTYNVIADIPEGGTLPGYTFFREHPLVYGPPNALIREVGRITSNADNILGNVLVVKHTRHMKNELMDCEEDNIPWIGIIKQCVRDSTFWY
ncbi:uncharacterized protein F5147DRAFT_777522 [Suillus discolor]|uniref:Uncharacterized protein n=1 Tax=Suillus discolor TaxID=1912936 RepID=A0A9P7JQ58_9AGAM|nr:uncharacterized protein F5147DRAFT_777522 [Suillus discolor]KAG2099000.1 hypothetical protein F5147DRAFT_777522 [Suillus discolor]